MDQEQRISKRELFRNFWRLAKPYWVSEERWRAGALLAAVVALSLGIVYMNVQFNAWYSVFYNTLQNLDAKGFWQAIVKFTWLAGIYIVIAVYANYLQQLLEIRWRRWMTEHFNQRWLDHQGYYRLQLTDKETDNPDQRIAEDINQFVSLTLGLSLGLLRSVVTFVSFVSILWALSGPLSFAFAGRTWEIQGYMLWVALIYAAVGTAITIWIGKPLVGLNFEQQRREANFRFALIRVRENAESIALYEGERQEAHTLRTRFQHVLANALTLIGRQKRLSWFTTFWGQLAIIFPMLVGAPRLFAKEIQLGGLMQIVNAFGKVYDSLEFVISSFNSLAVWKAVIDRLALFERGLFKAGALAVIAPAPAEERFDAAALEVRKPDGRVLLADLAFSLQRGERLLVQGLSGTGKSTLLRTLAGIWPFAQGRTAYPDDALFLSQRPYMPLGTLRELLCYPREVAVDDATLAELLHKVHLPHLAGRLDEVDSWSHILSLGEQQRIAIARALLERPQVLVLDEATSSIDEPTESALYQTLIRDLPGAIMISVGHRSSLRAFHNRFLDCQGEGRWALS
ncbi:ABC transporter ATP-binding protein/permease [Chitiniphilus purpureus]|uniref:ABC transporter ATP-binding protein/permease n=1 Tax=Chitiniphilus purpureus TaxID=2981137 RepID=A0ABY6DRR0_9NEIS|nr:ABC transporter ATP-binding protein/permease [Chitiniphilus sp. CD1]UXY17052.1 ABC transporter ATP-binding protein/permease [Chitiniphilus sp. CD1]